MRHDAAPGLDLDGETSAQLRAAYVERVFAPLARAWFLEQPEIQSLTVGFSRWWTDEAYDAVNEILHPSRSRDPPWLARDAEMPRAGVDARAIRDRNGLPAADGNSTLIVAFASCCAEGPGQGYYQPVPTPWAIARRGEAGGPPGIEIVGRVLRPWWEDRFDVGFRRGPDSPDWNPPDEVLAAGDP